MPSITLPVSLRGQLLNSVRSVVFNPISLFAANEPGVWYDPSDLTTLFQDTAGTTPVTTPGQTVALALDKSKGLVLGSELVTNGDFATDTVWTKEGGATIAGGLGNTIGAASRLRQDILTVGKFYQVTVTISNYVSGSPLIQHGGVTTTLPSANGTYTRIVQASGAVLFAVRDAVCSWDNISVKELPGFHATQATAASRPTYGIVPRTGRRNLLLATDDLAAAQWNTASNLTRTVSGGGTSSSGSAYTRLTATAGNTDHYLQGAGFALTAGISYAISIEMQYVSHRWVGISVFDGGFKNGATFDLLNGATGTNLGSFSSRTITPLGGNRYRLSAVYTAVSTANAFFGIVMLDADKAFTTTTVSNLTATTVDAGRVQIETGSSATAYQRVGSAFDVTEAGVASLSYLSFDGVDDFLVTPTITPGIDKVQTFAGVRKLSDAAAGTVFDLNGITGTASIMLRAPQATAANYAFYSGGSLSYSGAVSPSSYSAPTSSVLTGIGDIAADNVTLRVDGTQVAQVTTDQGTGNYSNLPLYIGRRQGTSIPFNGNLYSLIVRFGTNLDAGTITSTETWVGGKTGINIANWISPTIFARDDTAILDRFNATIERRAL